MVQERVPWTVEEEERLYVLVEDQSDPVSWVAIQELDTNSEILPAGADCRQRQQPILTLRRWSCLAPT